MENDEKNVFDLNYGIAYLPIRLFFAACNDEKASEGLAYTVSSGTVTITGIGTCTDNDLVIPSKLDGYPVTSIDSGAFRDCTELTSVIIPDSVTSIGVSAFSGCTGLTSIVIPNSVTSIGMSAFYGCTGLTNITIPNIVTSIGDFAFSGCTGLTSITIPNIVTSIGISAFYGCTGLTNITIGNGVTSIGDSTFSGCTSLTSIKYRGTKEEWNAISKGNSWDLRAGEYTITYNYKGE